MTVHDQSDHADPGDREDRVEHHEAQAHSTAPRGILPRSATPSSVPVEKLTIHGKDYSTTDGRTDTTVQARQSAMRPPRRELPMVSRNVCTGIAVRTPMYYGLMFTIVKGRELIPIAPTTASRWRLICS